MIQGCLIGGTVGLVIGMVQFVVAAIKGQGPAQQRLNDGCPSCRSVQVEVIGGVMICNACGAES